MGLPPDRQLLVGLDAVIYGMFCLLPCAHFGTLLYFESGGVAEKKWPEKENSKLFLQNNMIVFGKVRLSQYRRKKNSFFGLHSFEIWQ